MSVNKVILKGRLGNNPENKNGVVKFSLATSETYKKKDSDEKVTKTQWHNIVAFSKLGEILQKFLSKGDEVLIIGKLEYNEHEGKYYTSVIADEFDFVSSSKNNNSSGNSEEKTKIEGGQNMPEDDLPF